MITKFVELWEKHKKELEEVIKTKKLDISWKNFSKEIIDLYKFSDK